MRKGAAFLLLTGLTSACATVDVSLTVRNPEGYPQIVRVEVLDPDGGTKRSLAPQRVEGNASGVVASFSVKEGGGYRVSSAIPGSATVFLLKREILDSGQKVHDTVELHPRAGSLLDDRQALDGVTAALKKIFPDAGRYPMDLESALKTKLKGLVLFEASGTMVEMMTLTAAQFGTGEIAGKDITFPGATASGEAVVSGGALAELSKDLPLYQAFRFATTKDAIYRFRWTVEGAGATLLPAEGADLLAAFESLSDTVKSQIGDILALNGEAVVYYLDQAYLARLVRLSLQQGRRLKEGEEIRPGDVITPAGAFTFEGERQEVKEYRDVVLNFYGGEVVVQTVPQPAKAAGTPLRGAAFAVTGYPTGKRKVILPEYLRVAPATVRSVEE